MSELADENFRLEIPTSTGTVILIGPAEMRPDEVAKVASIIAECLPILPITDSLRPLPWRERDEATA